MSVIVYNPKYLTVNGRRVPNTTDVKNFIWSHARWFLAAGEMKKFPDEVGAALLKHMEFLVEVTKANFESVKKELEEKKFKCDKCAFETNFKIAFMSHVKTHEKEEKANNDGLEVAEAAPAGDYRKPDEDPRNPEEGIPQGGTKRNPVEDKDGVGWYGGGVERDSE